MMSMRITGLKYSWHSSTSKCMALSSIKVHTHSVMAISEMR